MNLLSADLENAVNRTVKLEVSGGNFWRPWKSLGEKFCFPDNFCCFKMIFKMIFLILLVANLCFIWRSQGCKRCSHRKLKCYKTSLQVVQPLNYNFPPLKQHIWCTSSSRSGGPAPPYPSFLRPQIIFWGPNYTFFGQIRAGPLLLGQILDPLLTSYDKANIYTLSDIGLFWNSISGHQTWSF